MSKRKKTAKKRRPAAAANRPRASRAVAEPLARPPAAARKPDRRRAGRDTPERSRRRVDPSLAGAAVAALVAFAVYLATLHPSLPTGDSGELISAAYVLGVAHPPGYPLFTMLGHAVTWLPVGSVALRLNLLSALLDAATVGVVFVLIHRLVSAGRRGADRVQATWEPLVAAAVGSLLLAFSTVFWMYSVVGEVFALNNLLAAVLLLVALEWSRRPERVALLWVLAFLFGLALTNQQTIIAFAPALLVLAWRAIRRVRLRDVGIAVALFLAGLLPYAYLPLTARREPSVNWGDPQTFDRFRELVTRANYGTFRLAAEGRKGSAGEQLDLLSANFARGFVVAGLVLAALGLWWTWRNRRAEGLALAVAFLVAGPVFVSYARVYVPDELTKGVIERFYILPSIPLAALAGAGAWQMLLWARRSRLPALRPATVTVAVAAALLAVPAAAAVAHYDTADQRGNHVALHYAEDLLAPLEPGALLLMRGDENLTSVLYAQRVEHVRTDIVAVDVELLKLPSTVEQVRREHPGVAIPFDAYDGGRQTSLADLVQANIGKRPVYFVGVMEEPNFAADFDKLWTGFARRLLPKGRASDPYALMRREAARFAALRYPEPVYPGTSWETVIGRNYASVAFHLAYALQVAPGEKDLRLAAEMYRRAIRLAPDFGSAYKNLGLVLRDSGGDPKEIIAVWERFLVLEPSDPQAGAIRAALERLKAEQ